MEELVKRFRKMCVRCRILEKKVLDVCMEPVKPCYLNIAPAFYMSQVDISGPYLCYSSHNKRATIKVWYIVFCCSTTGAIYIYIYIYIYQCNGRLLHNFFCPWIH